MKSAVFWLTPWCTCFLGAHGILICAPLATTRPLSSVIQARRWSEDDDFEPRSRRGIPEKQRRQYARGPYKDFDASSSKKRSPPSTIPMHISNDQRSLNLKLGGLAREGAPERAQELYESTLAQYLTGKSAVMPDTVSFNTVLKAWQNNPARATRFWESAVDVRKDVQSYNTYLLAFAKAGMYGSAETVLQEMRDGIAEVPPDRISWNTVIRAYASAMYRDRNKDRKPIAERAETLLKKMIGGVDDDAADPNCLPPKPDAITFNTVISAWASYSVVKVSAAKTYDWLRFMQQEDSLVRPNLITYNTVLKAFSRHREDSVALRVLALLQEMRCAGLSPDKLTYEGAMEALCLNGEIDQASRLFETLIASPHRPDASIYTPLLNAWMYYAAKADSVEKRREAVQGVQNFLVQTKELSKKWPECAPTERSYTTILKIIAESRLSNAGVLARQVLAQMRQDNVTAKIIHYNAALLCYTKSTHVDKAVGAEALMEDMKKAGVACNTISYNTLINAAARSYGNQKLRERSMQIGLRAFDRLQRSPDCQPNSMSYACYFKFLQRVLPATSPDYLPRLKYGFRKCCEQGCLDNTILQRILNSFTETEMQHLFEENYDNRRSLRTLPREWSINGRK